MNKSTKNEIVSNIRELEDNFKIIQTTRARDVGMDFTAIKEETETTSRTTIGIECKHYRSSVSSSDKEQRV